MCIRMSKIEWNNCTVENDNWIYNHLGSPLIEFIAERDEFRAFHVLQF